MADTFKSEAAFEDVVVRRLKPYGWTGGVLHNPTEQDVLDNWAHILYENNKGIDQLNGCPPSRRARWGSSWNRSRPRALPCV